VSDAHLTPPPDGNLIPGWVGIHPYTIGRHTYIGAWSHIAQNTNIGHFCSIGNSCTLGATRHPTNFLTTFPFQEILDKTDRTATNICCDVWVGCNAVILEGVTVGHGAVIGAGAVVTADVPPYGIVVGNPAKLLRYRFASDLIADLLETHWWDLPAEVIKTLPIYEPAKCVSAIRELARTKLPIY